ncbi:MAG TPA: chloride channel protein, partial [Gemmatimonadaceae bacterium]
LGGAYGLAVRTILPGAHVAPGALALVGMAGLVSGSTHAPLTAIMMVFEMTGDYGLILPLMLTSVLAYAIARRLYPESIYTEWLVRRGVVLTHGADAAVLARLPVHDCLNRTPVVIPEAAKPRQILEVIGGSRQTEFPVVDSEAHLVGMLTPAAIRDALQDGDRLGTILVAADLAVPEQDPLTSEDTLLTALRRLGGRDVSLLPVVRPDDRERLEGTVSRQDLMAAYERALTAEGGGH